MAASAGWRADGGGRRRRDGRPGRTARSIRVCDLAGRPRGTGFLADRDGTLVTSHEAVDGLARLVLHAPGDAGLPGRGRPRSPPLPEHGLALVATEGLDLAAAAGRARRARPSRPAHAGCGCRAAREGCAWSAPPRSRTPPPTASTSSTRCTSSPWTAST